ncbi:MAG: WecB/TagA/CpsF family glycosyltransferase [Candidatus Magasanikbacteria bacterium]
MTSVLGVKIDNLTMDEAVGKAREFLYNGKQNFIFTPNPEMLVDAQSDEYFKTVLNFGDLNLCDGFGISLVSLGKIKRITGVDFVFRLCEMAQTENKSIFLVGSESREILKKTVDNLKKQFPKLRIAGFHPGPQINSLLVEDKQTIVPEPEMNDQAIHEIIVTAPDILLVAFGHNKQEKWIYENIKNFPSVKIAMGVGGTFDYLSGTVKRAPCFMRKIGLEWVYRLIVQPSRIKRIFKATVVFLALIVSNLFKK